MKLNLLTNFIKVFSVLAILSFGNSWSQAFTVTYGFANSTTISGTTDPTPVPTATGVTSGSFSSSIGTNPNAATRFSFVGWGTGATNGIDTFSGALDTNNYYSVTITPAAGFYLDLNTVTYTVRRSGTGIRQCSVRSSLDYTTNLPVVISPVNANLSIASPNIVQLTDNTNSNLVGTTHNLESSFNYITQPITFRIYAWNSEALTGSFSIDDFAISGVAIPAAVWNGTAWSNVTGPTNSLDAVVNGVYNTTNNGNFTAKNLIVGAINSSLTVASATGITVQEAITNNAAASAFEVQNNANIIQSGLTNDNVGNITVNRNSTPMIRLDYTFWGSPVAGQNLLNFSPDTTIGRVYDYDENANAFTNAGLPTNFVQGKGYSVRAPNTYNNTPTTFNGSFVGLPNNGTIIVPVFNTGAPKGYNNLGNPYPSPISAVIFLSTNTNVSSIYYWTHTLQGAAVGANYATFNGTGTVSAAGGEVPNNFIQSGQGFIVKAINGPDVTFSNSMRVANYDNQFFRTANVTSNETSKNRIWLNLSNSENVLNQTLVGYVANATNALDNQFDASLFENTGSKLYSVINNTEYAIQGKALPFENTDSVALGFKTDVAGSYTISIAQLDGLFSGNQNVFLLDNQTGITHNLKSSNYTFATNAGTFNARFSLVYQAALKVENPVFDSNSVVVYTKDNALNINSGNTLMSNVKVFDIRGSLVYEKNNINSSTTSINDLSLNNGVLIVKITSTEGNIVSKKVLF